MDADDTRLVIDDLRNHLDDADARFEVAGSYTRARVDHNNEILLQDPLKYERDKEASRTIWQAVGAHCAKIGWDITDPSTWDKARRASRPQLPMKRTPELRGHVAALAIQEHCSEEKIWAVVDRVGHHLLVSGELGHEFLGWFLCDAGISTGPKRNPTRRANRVIKYLLGVGFMHKHRPHGHGHATFFVLDARFDQAQADEACEQAAGAEKKEKKVL
jgi:hypothetical protein